MAITLDDLVAEVAGLSLPNSPSVFANWTPDTPDDTVTVIGAVAGNPVLDGAAEPGHVHVLTRATTDKEAEATALALHRYFAGPLGSFTMGTTRVMSVESLAPVFLMRDVKERTTYIGVLTFTTFV